MSIQFESHACVFLDEDEQALFRLTERPNGGCHVETFLKSINLESLLTSLGCPLEMIPEVIARLNLAQEVEIRDAQGEPSVFGTTRRPENFSYGPSTPNPSYPVHTWRRSSVRNALLYSVLGERTIRRKSAPIAAIE